MGKMIARLAGLCALALAAGASAAPPLDQFLSYPFLGELTAADQADRVAWVRNLKGARNIWVAAGPGFTPRQVTANAEDDGQELTNLSFSPDGARLVWVRGGDHDANWPAAGNLQPDPASAADQPQLTIWTASTAGGAPVKLTEGDMPVISAAGLVAYLKDGQVWSADPAGKAKAERLFFDRGRDAALVWSPDGTRLAFVSQRGDHNFIGVFTLKDRTIVWLAPSTGRDSDPAWSPDGKSVAFARRAGSGGAPEPLLREVPQPWAVWTADATSGEGQAIWRSPTTLDGSFPRVPDGINLMWMAGDRLTFRAEVDGWPHLWSVPAAGGTPLLLTPGEFMVEHVAPSRDRRALLFSANTGGRAGDDDRRHMFRVAVDAPGPVALSGGEGLEWTPVAAGGSHIAFISATPVRPAALHVVGTDGRGDRAIDAPVAYPSASLVVPKLVSFKAADGLVIQGQLFETPGGAARKPGVIFVHGGPSRQMLLGWSYMGYYSNAYAMNQYLASRGFVVLSVNYRLGIGYGRAFQHAAKSGAAGGAEYQDVLAGAHFLQKYPGVDADRIGIWGGSYGGYLTAMALARDSAIFKAGVDLHGVHDWSATMRQRASAPRRYEQGEWEEAAKVAFQSSPVADIATWRSPVLLIQGDDDRNVDFAQTVDLARRLGAQGVDYRELVLPNEIHDFLRASSWLKADSATAAFLEEKLKP
jgi:dipeptidyl aminopeptidase/acylaminoacyl peptidase